MMLTNEDLFIREFRKMMRERSAVYGAFHNLNFPLPDLPTLYPVPKYTMVLVKGVKEPFFDRLNGEEVFLLRRGSLKKRQVLSDGTFRVNEKGDYVYDTITVPQDSAPILSKRSIGLRRIVNGREHKVSQGYKYVDYVDTKQGRRYIYIVPKQHIYRLNLCTLILTPYRRRAYYKGCRLAFQNGIYLYLYVVPFKYRETESARVIGVKASVNFDQEVSQIISYWMEQNILFDLRLTALEDIRAGVANLGIQDFSGTLLVEDYRPYEKSLAEEGEENLEEISD